LGFGHAPRPERADWNEGRCRDPAGEIEDHGCDDLFATQFGHSVFPFIHLASTSVLIDDTASTEAVSFGSDKTGDSVGHLAQDCVA
jgi:hypothetical protein